MGTHLRVLRESYPVNTNMTGFRRFSKIFCILALWTKVASALEGICFGVRKYIYHSYSEISLTSVVWICDNFENKFLGVRHKLAKYLKQSCR